MLIQTTVQKKETVTKEVRLPFYSGHPESRLFRISKNESIMTMFPNGFKGYFSFCLYPKGCLFYEETLSEALNATPCDKSFMEQAFERMTQSVEDALEDDFSPTNEARQNEVRVDNTQVQY